MPIGASINRAQSSTASHTGSSDDNSRSLRERNAFASERIHRRNGNVDRKKRFTVRRGTAANAKV